MISIRHIMASAKAFRGRGVVDTTMGLINTMINLTKKEGVKGVIKKVNDLGSLIDVPAFYNFVYENEIIPLDEQEKNKALLSDHIVVNWLIPEMSVGSGGHFNIFRFVTMLENRGIHNRIYVINATYFTTDEALNNFLSENYNLGNDKIEVFCNTDKIGFAHATIATGWQTCYFLRRFNNTISKFYFVQDFEPCFSPMSTEYLLAENTYNFGFRGITAGDWLKNKLHDEYNMKTESFFFSYDKGIYSPGKKRDNQKRLFLYARPVTPRRCFELALLALCRLTEKMPELEVVMAGWDVSNYKIPFNHKNLGNLKLEELSDLYAQSDICLVMSTSNLSLLPIEIMASNSVVACTKGDNNTWMVNDSNAIMLSIDPTEMADTLYDALNDEEKLKKLRDIGLKYAQEFTDWEKEGDKVYNYVIKGIKEDYGI